MTPKNTKVSQGAIALTPGGGESILISGPKLRRALDISAVTLWRWRHDKQSGFPTATVINGRLYFPWTDVLAWVARQQRAA